MQMKGQKLKIIIPILQRKKWNMNNLIYLFHDVQKNSGGCRDVRAALKPIPRASQRIFWLVQSLCGLPTVLPWSLIADFIGVKKGKKQSFENLRLA